MQALPPDLNSAADDDMPPESVEQVGSFLDTCGNPVEDGMRSTASTPTPPPHSPRAAAPTLELSYYKSESKEVVGGQKNEYEGKADDEVEFEVEYAPEDQIKEEVKEGDEDNTDVEPEVNVKAKANAKAIATFKARVEEDEDDR